jgi:hypothetical protein
MTQKINKFAYDIVNTNITNAIAKKEQEINNNTIAFLLKKYGKEAEKLSKAAQVITNAIIALQAKIRLETKEISGLTTYFSTPSVPTLSMSIQNYNQKEKLPAIIKAHEDKQQILMKLALGENVAAEVNALIQTISKIK